MKWDDAPICERSKKKGFETYNECVKYARYRSQRNREMRKHKGANAGRKAVERKQYKACKSVYKCEYCGLYHFSSWIPHRRKKY